MHLLGHVPTTVAPTSVVVFSDLKAVQQAYPNLNPEWGSKRAKAIAEVHTLTASARHQWPLLFRPNDTALL